MRNAKGQFVKGFNSSPDTQFKKGQNLGEKNPTWKGDKVTRKALHTWIKTRISKPLGCNHCGEIKPLDLANKSQEYKRELNDWLWLCKKCHMKYDKEVHKLAHARSVATRKRNGNYIFKGNQYTKIKGDNIT